MDHKLEQDWANLQDIWNNSSKTKKINFEITHLIDELKHKTSQWEKDAIKKDLELIKSTTSQFEKESIRKDLHVISGAFKRFVKWLKG